MPVDQNSTMYNIECDLDGFRGPLSYKGHSPPGITNPPNPYTVDDSLVVAESAKLSPKERAPALEQLDLEPTSVKFIKQLDNGLEERGPCGVFQIQNENEERLLKIFRGIKSDPLRRGFVREARAYQNFVGGQACSAGVVPYCYGWTVIILDEWTFPDGGPDWLYKFRYDEEPIMALVLEYFPNASRLSLRNVTPQLIKDAWDGLEMIHNDRVLHGDPFPRNILVLPSGRIVWIDFDLASTWPWHRSVVHHGTFCNERWFVWGLFYRNLLTWKCYLLKQLRARGELRDDSLLRLVERALLDVGTKFHDHL